jgi:hypothetical protein
MKAKSKPNPGRHDCKKVMLEYLTGSGPSTTDAVVKGAANWHTFKGMGYDVGTNTNISDVFATDSNKGNNILA